MPKTKKYLPFPIFILIATVIGIGVWKFIKIYTPIAQPIDVNEINNIRPDGKAHLEASPAPASVYLGSEIKLDINATSITDNLTGVELKLNFDPAKMQITGIEKSEYFPNILANAIFGDSDGHFTTTLGVPVNSGGLAGWGTIGKVTFLPKELGTHTITFDDTVVVSINSTNQNAVRSTTPIVITAYYPGDFNKDKVINIYDYNLLVAHYGSPYGVYDYNHLVANYGKTSP